MASAHAHFPPNSIEPLLVSIPGAWFLMGSASGQDCERPVHRVWTDSFLLAATQVTNAEYQARGSTTADASLKAIAIRKAHQVKFNSGSNESSGTLIFNFKLKN